MPTQTTDLSGNPYGITYASSGLTWTIAKNVDVTGTVAGIYSPFGSSALVNKGTLVGGTLGVYFDASALSGTLSVTNKSSGEISAPYGIFAANFTGAVRIANDGDIHSSLFGIYVSGSTDVALKNSGDISGDTFAVFLGASTVGAKGTVVDNHGMIEAPQFGLYISGPNTVGAKVFNHDDGIIKGGTAAFVGLSAVDLKNEGKIVGTVVTSFYADKITNKGNIKGDVVLGEGNDVFKNKDNAKTTGLIDSDNGNDKVILGNKAEKLLFASDLDAALNVDTIKNFASGKDEFFLDDGIFTMITPGTLSAAAFHKGTSAADADDRIIYDKKSGALYYDPDGLGGVGQTQFAKLDGGTKLKASDFTIGEYAIII
ncbi:MAG: hypothetical protein J0H08_12440 [Rhizobiales bacterium]|nr:hypothetical protein [Hyphomicrobiales bacterium]